MFNYVVCRSSTIIDVTGSAHDGDSLCQTFSRKIPPIALSMIL